MNKRILLISNMYPSERFPHYGVFIKNTENILNEAGYNVKRICLYKMSGKAEKLVKYTLFNMRVIFSLICGKYDIVYTHYASHTALPIILAKRFIKKPIIVNVHGNDIIPETKADEKYLELSRKLLALAERVVCPSPYFAGVLNKSFNIDSDKIVIYPSGGVDTELFKKTDKISAIKKLNLSTEYRYIGYISRIEKNKGWDIFLEACSRIVDRNDNIRLIVVGDGEEIPLYNSKVETLGLENKIIKYDLVKQDEMVSIFNALDVFVFPTYRVSESLGLVGLEAMACETITVVPDKYGPSSYGVHEINAYVFKSGCAISLEDCLKRALNNQFEDMPQRARETALMYKRENFNQVLLDVFKKLETVNE